MTLNRRTYGLCYVLLTFAWPASIFGQTTSPPVSGETVQMAPYEVVEPRLPVGFREHLQAIDHVFDFDGPFLRLRNGPLIEAILWRHRYLSEHPAEKAIIVTIQDGIRIRSATTIYTKDGQLYASSCALGEDCPIRGFTIPDLDDPKRIEHIRGAIQAIRDYRIPENLVTPADIALAAKANSNESVGLYLEHERRGPSVIIEAEETGDYSYLGDTHSRRSQDHTGQLLLMAQYGEAADEVLSWTFRVLHDPARAGIVPVALSPVEVKESSGKVAAFEAIVFEWEGVHYVYNPDFGTEGVPLPMNPVTGRPYLCVRNGGMMECAYFCATYLASHPREKTVMLSGDPAAVAFTSENSIGMFGLDLGPFISKPIGADNLAKLLANSNGLISQRNRLAAQARQAIPTERLGDTADLQMRRVFLAFQSAGIAAHLKSGDESSLTFTWQGTAYVYGADQEIRLAPKG